MLSDQDVYKLFTSEHLSLEHPYGMLVRLIFGISLATTWLPGILTTMEMHQVVQTLSMGKAILRFTSGIAGDDVSKTVKGGLRARNYKPVEATSCQTSQLGVDVCIFDDVQLYSKATETIHKKKNNFFYL